MSGVELLGGSVLAVERFEDAVAFHVHERPDPHGDLADDAACDAGNDLDESVISRPRHPISELTASVLRSTSRMRLLPKPRRSWSTSTARRARSAYGRGYPKFTQGRTPRVHS